MERKWAKAAEIPSAELTRQLQDMLTRYGFTSGFDLSSPWDNTRALRDRIERGEASGPRILSTGPGMLPVNAGLPGPAAMAIIGWMSADQAEIGDETQARAATRALLESGVDGIKLFISAPSKSTIPEPAIRASVEEAHAAGKPVFVHPNNAGDAISAIRAGVDVLAHTTPMSGPWEESLLNEMRSHNVALIPTLQVFQYNTRHDRRSTQDKLAETSAGQLRAWNALGGDVLFGTDVGYVDYDPRQEYDLMASAGMNFRDILRSLTATPALRFNAIGRIEPGAEGDITVLGGDTVAALTDVRHTIRNGKVIFSSTADPAVAAHL
jgi:imidazolonepropionase-like amidohydrolase